MKILINQLSHCIGISSVSSGFGYNRLQNYADQDSMFL